MFGRYIKYLCLIMAYERRKEMNLGNNIFKLRKEKHLSQEQLAEKINVTRQTISNWELGETSPNPTQLKQLSKVLNVSIDDELDNDIKEIIVEKVSNTEKLAGIIIKILKVMGILIVLYFIFIILAVIFFTAFPKKQVTEVHNMAAVTCSLNDKRYEIKIIDDKSLDCKGCSEEMISDLNEIVDFTDIETSGENIETYFEENGGMCK